MTSRYWIATYSMDLADFSPQVGVRVGPYSLFGLRKAFAKLRQLGYPCARDEPSVMVIERNTNPFTAAERKREVEFRKQYTTKAEGLFA